MTNILEKADVTPMPIGFSEPMRNLLALAFYSSIPLEKKKEIKDCPAVWSEQEKGHYEGGRETFQQSSTQYTHMQSLKYVCLSKTGKSHFTKTYKL